MINRYQSLDNGWRLDLSDNTVEHFEDGQCNWQHWGTYKEWTKPGQPGWHSQSVVLAEKALRDALEYVGYRNDGDLRTIAERAELWMRKSRVLIDSMKGRTINAELVKLSKEYRPTMTPEVLHSWAADMVAAIQNRADAKGEKS